MDLPWTVGPGGDLLKVDPVTAALIIWAALLAVTVLFLAVAGPLTSWQSRRLTRAERRAAMLALSPGDRHKLRKDAAELLRDAMASAVAAKQARATVAEARARCERAQQEREAAWRAFDEAQKAYEVALREASAARSNGNGNGHGNGHGADDSATAEEVSRAALAAYKRGDLTVDQLGVVFRQATGWDPTVEERAREVESRRMAESRARKLFQAAAAAERSAAKAAEVAVVAAQALAEESMEMAAEARAARDALNATVRKRPLVPHQRRSVEPARVRVS